MTGAVPSSLALRDAPSPNHDARPPGQIVDMLVVHYTGMESDAAALRWLTDPASRVSAHYLIDDDGGIYGLVDEAARAWHAGVAGWRTTRHMENGEPVWVSQRHVNERSIGIELANPGHDFGYRPYRDRQIDALRELCVDILARHPIPAHNIVGHSDVAPARKRDPGELFPWARLAEWGIGLWPDEPAPDIPPQAATRSLLAEIGYPVDLAEPEQVIAAFQRRFSPDKLDGRADGATRARIAAVAQKVVRSVVRP